MREREKEERGREREKGGRGRKEGMLIVTYSNNSVQPLDLGSSGIKDQYNASTRPFRGVHLQSSPLKLCFHKGHLNVCKTLTESEAYLDLLPR